MEENSARISPTLLDFEYYKNKLPLYLRNSNSFVSHFYMFFQVLTSIEDDKIKLLELFDIFDEHYFETWNIDPTSTTENILDVFASLFNISRQFNVAYVLNDNNVAKSLTLNNSELYTLIKAQIIKDYFSGTRKELVELYNSISLNIRYITASPMECSVYFVVYDTTSNNLKDLFLAGLLTIESLGIAYTKVISDSEIVQLKWNVTAWDVGCWDV